MTSETRSEKVTLVSALLPRTLTLRALCSHLSSMIALRPSGSEESNHMERLHVGTLLGTSSVRILPNQALDM